MIKRPKIAIVGGGNVGTACAVWAANKRLGDIVVVDVPEQAGQVKGRLLDLAQCSPIEGFDCTLRGTSNFELITASDVVILTAGIPRKPRMSRDDLIDTNVRIVKEVCERVRDYAPGSIVIVVSNPLDAMVYTAWKATGFETQRIVGQAGCLDMARFKYFIAQATGLSVEDINAVLLGGHGDDMVPLPRYTNIAGVPMTDLLDERQVREIVEHTRKGGGEIVGLLKTSAYYAPAAGVMQMVEAIVQNKHRILPCAAHCQGEYGIGGEGGVGGPEGLFVGVPTVLGASGVERIIELELNDDERALLHTSATHVKELNDVVRQRYPELA